MIHMVYPESAAKLSNAVLQTLSASIQGIIEDEVHIKLHSVGRLKLQCQVLIVLQCRIDRCCL